MLRGKRGAKHRFCIWLYLPVAIGVALTGCASSGSTASLDRASEEITLVTARPDIVQQPDEFMVVDEMPRLIGGLESIQKNVVSPAHLRKTGFQGTVLIQLIVTEDGELHDLIVAKSVHPELDQIAMDVVSKAQFIPGKIAGQPVSVQVRVPVRFFELE